MTYESNSHFTQYYEFDAFTNLKSEVNLAVMEVIRELGIKMALDDDIGIIKGLIKWQELPLISCLVVAYRRGLLDKLKLNLFSQFLDFLPW